MKYWIIILLLVVAVPFPSPSHATYHINNFFIQNRVNEDGARLYRILFSCTDDNGHYPAQSVLGNYELTDPDNSKISPVYEFTFLSYYELDGNYDSQYSRWHVGSGVYLYSCFISNLSELKEGKYTLTVTDHDGQSSSATFEVKATVDLPVISSKSYSYYLDQQGNFIWEWDVPYDIDPSLSTNCRALIDGYDKNGNMSFEYYYTVPTHLGRLFVPKEVFDKILSYGTTFKLGFQLRSADNSSRTYAKYVLLNLKHLHKKHSSRQPVVYNQ